MSKAIAIITARGGSKRFPRKNVRPFLGRPIIQYSIDAALDAGIFDTVMVSTDDPEIAELSLKFGAQVPFLRSPDNSGDQASTVAVLLEVLQRYEELEECFQYACCCYPTAPFISAAKLNSAYLKLQNANVDAVFPVTRYTTSVWRALKMEDNGRLQLVWPENEFTRSQDLPTAYHDTGQFYFFRVKPFLETGSLLTSKTFGLEINPLEVQDIDSEEDWKLAEMKYQKSLEVDGLGK